MNSAPRPLTASETEALEHSDFCWWCLDDSERPTEIAAGAPACAECAKALANEKPVSRREVA